MLVEVTAKSQNTFPAQVLDPMLEMGMAVANRHEVEEGRDPRE